MLQAEGVGKRYGDIEALADVSFEIGDGEVVGLLGPNGAGKTTLLRILTGFFEPSTGRVTIDGVDVEEDPIEARKRVGYLPEQNPLYPEMLVQEYLSTVAELRGLEPANRRSLISDAVWATGLENHVARPIAELSKGYRQRVGIAQAILHRPKLLVLDEPTSGLDPTQVDQVRSLVARLRQTATILFSTHVLSEVEQVCDRAIVLLSGRVQADARLADLRSTRTVIVGVAEDGDARAAAVAAALREVRGISEVRNADPRPGQLRFAVDGASPDLPRELFRLARDRRWELVELTPLVRDLEAVFRDLVRKQGVAEEVSS